MDTSGSGTYEMGASVVAFDARWERVTMSNGLDAQLFTTTRAVAVLPQASSG